MSLILDLAPELETELAEEAARLQLPLAEYALRLLRTGRSITEQPRTGAELVAYWERAGVIGSRPQIGDSQAHARKLRRQAQLRVRE